MSKRHVPQRKLGNEHVVRLRRLLKPPLQREAMSITLNSSQTRVPKLF